MRGGDFQLIQTLQLAVKLGAPLLCTAIQASTTAQREKKTK
jgi:hypothetical protein